MFSQLSFRQYNQLLPRWIVWTIRLLVVIAFLVAIGSALFSAQSSPLFAYNKVFVATFLFFFPALIVISASLWRQYCPLAFANQLPRTFSLSLARRLPNAVLNISIPISTTLFLVLVWSVAVFAATEWLWLSMLVMFGLAFLGGVLINGKAGWCVTFCPMSAYEYATGYAPLAVHSTRYCPTCVLCVKECMDYGPRNYLLRQISRHLASGYHFRTFLPFCLTGFVIGITSPGAITPAAELSFANAITAVQTTNWLLIFVWMSISLAVFGTLQKMLGLSMRMTLLLSIASYLAVFYFRLTPIWLSFVAEQWQGKPFLAGTVSSILLGLSDEARQQLSVLFSATFPAIFAFVTLVQGKTVQRQNSPQSVFLQVKQQQLQSVDASPEEFAKSTEAVAKFKLVDRTSGVTVHVEKGTNLLMGMYEHKIAPRLGCRSGSCGMCATVLTYTSKSLAEPSELEARVLRYRGLGNDSRLACCVEVESDITMNYLDAPRGFLFPRARGAPFEISRSHQEIVPDDTFQGHIVIVGGGIAAHMAAMFLREFAPVARVTLVSDLDQLGTNRLRLLEGLSPENDRTSFAGSRPLFKKEHFVRVGITLRLNETLLRVESNRNRITTTKGNIEYDKLMLCLGARTELSEYLQRLERDVVFRIDDAESVRALRFALDSQKRAKEVIILGGGPNAVEAALRIAETHKVTMIFDSTRLLENYIDRQGSIVLAQCLQRLGVKLYPEKTVAQISATNDRNTYTFRLGGGATLDAEIMVAAIGVGPNKLFSTDSPLRIARGITVDSSLESSIGNIFAAGGCAEVEGKLLTRWGMASDSAYIAAQNMINIVHKPFYVRTGQRIDISVAEFDLMAFGRVSDDPQLRFITRHEGSGLRWWMVATNSEGRIVGGVFINCRDMQERIHRAFRAEINFRLVLERRLGITPSARTPVGIATDSDTDESEHDHQQSIDAQVGV